MKRLIAGAAVTAAALGACGQTGESPVPHIVALAVEPVSAAPPVTVPVIVPAARPVRPVPPPPPRASRSAPRTPVAVRVPAGDVWAALARCESGGNPRAVGGGGRYFGAFQFSIATWNSLGMSGNPADAPYAVQADAARRLQARSGWGQWPRCARRLGLI